MEPTLPAACGGGPHAGYVNHSVPASRSKLGDDSDTAEQRFHEMPCYTFDEAAYVFAFWGRNSELKLLSVEQMLQPLDLGV